MSMDTETRQEITNECSCTDYNEDTQEDTPSADCQGWCWEDTLGMFTEDVMPLFDARTDSGNEWRIDGFPVWDGTRGGVFTADTPKEMLSAITIRGGWILRYRLDGNTLDAILSHHDAPTGGRMTIAPYDNGSE